VGVAAGIFALDRSKQKLLKNKNWPLERGSKGMKSLIVPLLGWPLIRQIVSARSGSGIEEDGVTKM
jgi:hypothetical protein